MLLSVSFRSLVARLSASTLVAWGVLYYAFSVVLPAMQPDLGWSSVTIAAGLSVGLLTSGVLSPWVGARIDGLGSRGLMASGVVLGAGGLLVWSVASSVALYLSAWVLIGAGMSATLYEPAFATLVRADPTRSRTGILVVSVVGALAATLFLPLSAALIDILGWRDALRTLAAILLLTSLPLNLTLPIGPADPVVCASSKSVPWEQRAISTARSSNPLRAITGAFMLANAASVAFGAHLVVFLVAQGQTAHAAAWIAGSAGFAKIAGRLASAVVTRRSSLSLLRLSLVTQALSMVPAILWPSTAAMLFMVLAFGACSGARTVLRPTAVLELVGTQKFGQRNGVVQLFSTIAKSAAPAGFGLVLGGAGLSVAWGVLVGLMLISALILPRETSGSADPRETSGPADAARAGLSR
ncbi:MAG: MFS transporter [Nannocystales bacterium]